MTTAREFLDDVRTHYTPPPPKAKRGELEFGPDTRLGDGFWNTPIEPLGTHLRHIRQAALAQLVSPTAVFGAVLARISAGVHHSLQLPAIIATPSPLCTFVLVIGDPASGKGAASDIAVELLPSCTNLEAVADCMPIGSPQGLVEIMYGLVEDPDSDKGKPKRDRVRYNAYPILDEGAALAGLGNDAGESLLATTCTLWSGKVAGAWNATVELQRRLDPASYTFGICIDLQPASAALILDKDKLGAPQRYLFHAAAAPECPDDESLDVDNPGPLHWSPPEHHEIEHLAMDRNNFGWERRYLEVDPEIRKEVRDQRRVNAKRTTIGNGVRPLDEHRTLVRLRVAGLLSLLNGTYRITPELWALAEMVVTVSAATRDVVQLVNRAEVERRTEAQGYAEGKREVVRLRVVEDDATEKLAGRIVDAVTGGLTARRDVARKVGGKADAFGRAVGLCVAQGWLTEGVEPTSSDNRKPRPTLVVGPTRRG